jgi:hypothetical protein
MQQTPKPPLAEFFNRKDVRLTLAAACAFFAALSTIELLSGGTRAHALHGGGGLLIWSGWAIINALYPFGKTLPAINALVYVGLALLVTSWFMR